MGRRMDPYEVFLHLAVVFAVLGALALLVRQIVPALVFIGLAAGVGALSRGGRPDDPGEQAAPLPGAWNTGHGSLQDELPPSPESDPIPYLPPAVPAMLTEPWAPCSRGVDLHVAARHRQARHRLLKQTRLSSTAVLIPDPTHPDGPTIAVVVGGEYVGDLAPGEALSYLAPLTRLSEVGRGIQVPIDVKLTVAYLPTPEGLTAANAVPRGAVALLPHGDPLQVRDVEAHRGVLDGYLRPGSQVWLALTLQADRETVRVHLDGHALGVLTGTDAESTLPLVAFCEARRLTPVAVASARGSSLKADVVLHCVRAQDADEHWLRSLGPNTP